ncbi:MAG: hypothetical protein ACRDI0_12760 [Actinomycetota bacterium]
MERLMASFGRFVDLFEGNRQFSGPSLYFHAKAIATLRSHPSPADVLGDDAFFDHLYATLASWGLHRMGPGNAKLVEIDELKASLWAQRQGIEDLQRLRLHEIEAGQVTEIAGAVWEVLRQLRVGIGETSSLRTARRSIMSCPIWCLPSIATTRLGSSWAGRTSIGVGTETTSGLCSPCFTRSLLGVSERSTPACAGRRKV